VTLLSCVRGVDILSNELPCLGWERVFPEVLKALLEGYRAITILPGLFTVIRGMTLVIVGLAVKIGFSVRFRDSNAFRETLGYTQALVKPFRA